MRFPLSVPTNKPFDAVGFGLNADDHLIVVPRYPDFDTKTRLLEHKLSAGGRTATAMVALTRLGLKTAYAGRFGSDAEGHFGLATLKDEGVNTEHAEMVAGSATQIAFITIEEQSGERTIVWDRDDRLAYKPEEAPSDFGSQGRILHLDAHDPPACVRVAQDAKQVEQSSPPTSTMFTKDCPSCCLTSICYSGRKSFRVVSPESEMVELPWSNYRIALAQ